MVTYEAHVEVTIQTPQKCSHQSQIEHMLWVHFKCILYVITMKSLGSFNQSSQCSQYVITGSRPPRPQWEEELCSTKAKVEEQDHIITNLVGDNLEHLQDNMRLTAHINSSKIQMAQLEHRLGQVGSVLMGMIEGAIEREGLDSSEAGTLGASGNDQDDQGGKQAMGTLVRLWRGV